MTIAITIKEFRENTEALLKTALDQDETLIVTLEDGRNFAVVPGSDFQSFDETAYLLSTEANSRDLETSLKEAAEGKTVKIVL